MGHRLYVTMPYKVSFLPCLWIALSLLGNKNARRARGGDSHIKWTGMLVGNFEFNP